MLRRRIPNQPLMRLGMLFLVLGALSLRYLGRLTHLPEDATDGITGLLYGLAIGCLLVSLRPHRGTHA